ncbi:MAG: hypothetical protein QM479_06040 [Pseudomonadota bacterium]
MISNLNQQDLCQLLPHSGKMCLIDKVIFWDKDTLVAQTMSHIKADNPLRQGDKISTIIGIEYAAQTMAIHSALLQKQLQKNDNIQQQINRGGYLATTRNIQVLAEHIYHSKASSSQPLEISVMLLMKDTQGYTYNFEISSDNAKLLCGRLTIFLI